MRLPGWTEDLPPELFVFERHAAHGVKTAETPTGIVVALDTRLDDELIHEGWARDVIRHVQTLRKEAGLDVSDRIRLWLAIDDAELAGAVEHARRHDRGRVARHRRPARPTRPADASTRAFKVAGRGITAALQRA